MESKEKENKEIKQDDIKDIKNDNNILDNQNINKEENK